MPLDLSGDIAGLGKIVQIVRATDSAAFDVTTTTATDVPNLSVTITPNKSDSQIYVLLSANFSSSSSSSNVNVLITDSSNTPLSGAERAILRGEGTELAQSNMIVFGFDSPNTTSATTYKVRMWTTGGTGSIYGNLCTSQLLAIEVAA